MCTICELRKFLSCPFLANDVTKVTSVANGMKPKRTAVSDIQYMIHVYDVRYLSSSVRPGAYSVSCSVGVCHWDSDTLLISSTCPYSLYYGSTIPGL